MTTESVLQKLGFSFERGGAHTARTMMLDELTRLIAYVADTDASIATYMTACVDDNCLGKQSGKTRLLTYRHLVDLYSLDTTKLVFRSLLYFWHRDEAARPFLAMLCTFVRDGVFRASAEFVQKVPIGATIKRQTLEAFVDDLQPGRFSAATLKSVAQNINSTWTQSGHESGRAVKIRTQARATPGAVAYALVLGYVKGIRGYSLFETEYMKALDCSTDTAIALAEQASRRGWIVVKRIGDVIDVSIQNLLTTEEREWLSG